ncbi:hemolysin III family protein [Kamptonema cortianum]|nr:hemolysin III family protein [Geitlerinema splendidum]MDK3157707.1 hemolysin III family protein [Kamptonema cortianum]
MPSHVRIREPFNTFSHLAGAVLLLVGICWLLFLDPRSWVGLTVFGVAGALMFGASAAYHWGDQRRQFLRRLDHAAIYLMIAGSYTPLCLYGMTQPAATWVLASQWTLASCGAVVSLSIDKTPTWFRLALYLAMGWMALPVIGAILPVAGTEPVAWMFIGGAFYTIGAVVYGIKKPDILPQQFGFHGLWHLFVLGGAASHWMMARHLVAPV